MANSKDKDYVQLNVRLPKAVYDSFVHFVKDEHGYTYGDRPGFAQFFKDWHRGFFEIKLTEVGELVFKADEKTN